MSLLFIVAGAATYAIYKHYEPASLALHAILLLGMPELLATQLRQYVYIPAKLYIFPIYWSTILALTVAYRLSPSHPLAQFPGPLPAKVTKFWMSYVTARGNAHETARVLHAQYGDIVRIGPNELSFCRPEAIQPILGMKVMRKGPYYDTRQQREGHATLDGLRDFSEHAARRKPWNKAMSVAALKDYSTMLIDKVQELMSCLSNRQGKTIDISTWMAYFGFDFMGVMAFGHEFGMMKAGEDVGRLCHLIERGTTIAAYVSHVPWLFPILMSIPGTDREIKTMQALGKRCAEERVKRGSSVKDLFYYLTEEEQLKSSKVIASGAGDGLLAIIAGSDTAAAALGHICYFLLRDPECFKRLRQEIDEAFPNRHETFDPSKQADMPYLNACINEALRLYPPVLSGLQRTVEAGGHVICDQFIPENTKVSVNAYTMHHDVREFSPIPDIYWPDRWLSIERYTLPSGEVVSKDQVVTNRGSFLPFSYGPQNCAGKSLAIMEMRAVVCALVQAFDIQVAKGYDLDSWEKNIEDVYITNRGPLLVNVTPRH
ncbi:hypothetical protein NM688_g6036 [Phlebia brevispora]|uniref:Uncharacterized protein n=1 Tax=Phlebia brevispora TaxID=194682 RepID=A0ACC1SL64_9APHY|nr:hypothetical protein NM688_g6036 [Phlebia brevispora]